ncbi:MAG: hypothetical protein QN159_12265 [Armatimonadota bacterium]|nr:hypothetical protein [Armatimonadota bacterium]
MNSRFLPGCALALALCAACAEDFAPYNRIESLRVLAIQAEPAIPAPGEIAVLTPLVHVPGPDGAVQYRWSWCPLPGPGSAGYPCLLDEATLRQQLAQAGLDPASLPAYDLGNDETARLAHGLPPALLAQLCAPAAPDTPPLIRCDLGFPVQVRLQVRRADGSEVVDSVRTVHLQIDERTGPNANPTLRRIYLRTAARGDQPEMVYELDDDPRSSRAFRLRSNLLVIDTDERESESFLGPDPAGQATGPVMQRERLFASWFIETGSTRREVSTLIPGESTLRAFQENPWTPASARDFAPDTARVIVVLRDSRGGVSWKTARVGLAVAPDTEGR